MEITKINGILEQLSSDPKNGRDHILSLSRTLIEWLGFEWVENDRPRLLDFKTLKLKEALAPAPITGQEQIYRLSAEGQELRVRFAVLKKYDKKIIQYIVDNHVGLISYQARMKGVKQVEGREPYISNNPYYLHFIATAKYDRLWVIFNEGEQKRVLVFRSHLSQTQYNKILPVWKNISAKPKPEMSKLLWSSLDVKEVNKDFYKQIKEQFDALIGIAQTQVADFDETMTKQFAVRLIGRYIFCWFLKEKEVIPETLISSKTIEKYKDFYFQELLSKLFLKTLNAEVTDPVRSENFTLLDELYKNIPYLNGGLFDWHSEDILFEKLDLNAWLISFVKVLENFDFTVDESSSQYQQVAIDPEMLGRIFENLLASQNPDTEKMANQRKAFGAFYTPREIVDYMVNESLRAYLETQLMPSLPEQINEVAEPAVAYKGTLFENVDTTSEPTTMSKAEIADIGRKRERIKLRLDKLFANDCTENPFEKDETIQVRKALSSITVLDPACGSGAFPMGVMLRLMELRQIVGHGYRNSYDLKEEILSRNIFGVDIMPMAVEIARLRAWLSLVLEADYKPADRKNNFGIAALPNLDFKFICANSLIDSGYDAFLDKIQYNATLFRLDGEIQKLENIRNQYFDPRGDKNRKTELQQEFIATKQHIKEQISVGTLIKNYNLGDFFEKVDDWNPFDDSHPSSFFSPAWMFGIRDGFDAVIGNPPYVPGKSLDKQTKNHLQKNYKLITGKYDLYIAFLERGLELNLSAKNLIFIIPNTFLANVNTKVLRKYLLDNKLLKSITIYKELLFDNQYVENVVLFVSNIRNAKIFDVLNSTLKEIRKVSYDEILDDSEYSIQIDRNIIDDKILSKIFTNSKKFGTIAEICIGIQIGGSGDKNEIKSDFISVVKQNETYKKVLDGKDFEPFIINTKLKFIKYGNWLHRKRDEKYFLNPKIIIRQIGSTPISTIDFDNYYTLNTVYNSIIIDSNFEIQYLFSIINSSLLKYVWSKKFSDGKSLFPKIKKSQLSEIPIKIISLNKQKPFCLLVDEIIKRKKQNQNTNTLEKEIDVLVYKLYELTYDEVKIVDKDFWLSEEEYEQTKLS